MFLFPSIDLRDGKVVRLQQGNYDQQTTYGNDPVAQSRLFEQEGASWLHLVDLDGARAGRVAHLEVITDICQATKLKVEVGGGVRSEAAIDALLNVGVTRVSLGTAALQDWKWFEKLVADPSYQNRIVLDLGANKGRLTVSGWEKQLDTTALEIAQRVTEWPLAAIVYTDIATDGTMKGPNLEATAQIAQATRVPIVSSGGVGTLDHLRQLRRLPLQGAIVGRALYEGAFTLEEAISVVEQ